MNQLPRETFDKVLDEISFLGGIEEKLTPRTKKYLLKRLHNKQLIMAFEEQALAGWGLVEPLATGVVEIGFLYVKPEFRDTNAFHDLARELVLRKETVLFATYDRKLFDYVRRTYNFKESTLKEFQRLSRGRFVLKRLNLDALRSIGSRLKTTKPIYALLERS
ncbi:MAG: hypothetical protein ACKOWE_01490 [Micrococcales bacterium]